MSIKPKTRNLKKNKAGSYRNPDGFRMAEIQILVSRTALIATLLFPDFLHPRDVVVEIAW